MSAADDVRKVTKEIVHLFGPVTKPAGLDAVLSAARERWADEGRQGAIRAYHVTLDALNAPPGEWPCNRVKEAKVQWMQDAARWIYAAQTIEIVESRTVKNQEDEHHWVVATEPGGDE